MNLRTKALSELVSEIRTCRACIIDPISQPLPHEPRPVVLASSTARLCVAGQAPGLQVHKTGLPFNDRSGDRLREWLNIDRETFYDERKIAIVPMGFCFPGYDAKGSDLPPRKECRTLWHDTLFEHLPQIELILVIGQYAQHYHLGKRRKKTLTETVRAGLDYWEQENPVSNKGSIQRKYLPLPHPSWRNTAWLRKNPWFENEILPVLQAEVQRLLNIR